MAPKALKFNIIIIVCFCFLFGVNPGMLGQTKQAYNKTKYQYSTPELEEAYKLYSQKQYEKALEAYTSITKNALQKGNYEEAVFAMEKKAAVLISTDNLDRAKKVTDRAIELAQRNLPEGHFLIFKTYFRKGVVDHRLRDFYNARTYFDSALVHYNKSSDYDSSALFHLMEFKYYAYQYSEGSFDTLKKYLDKLMELESIKQRKKPDPNKVIDLMQAYPDLYAQKGDYDRAMVYAIQTYQYAKKNRALVSNQYFAESVFDLGTILYYKEHYDNTINLIEQIIPLVENTPRNQMPEYHSFYNLLGASHEAIKNYDVALSYFKKALEIPIFNENGILDRDRAFFRAVVKINMGRCHENLGNRSKAKQYFDESLKESSELITPPNPDLQTVYRYIGNYHLTNRHWKKALIDYDSALRNGIMGYNLEMHEFPDIVKKDFSREDLVILSRKAASLFHLAPSSEAPLSMLAAAENYVEQTHQALEVKKNGYLATEGKLFASKGFKELYVTGTAIALELYQLTKDIKYIDDGLKHMSRGKSQLFIEQMSILEIINSPSTSEDLKQQFNSANQKLDSLDERVNQMLDLNPLDEALPATVDLHIQWMSRLQNLKEQVAQHVRAPEHEVSINSIRQRFGINGERTFIEYLDADSIIYAIGISENDVSFKRIKKGSSFEPAFNSLMAEVGSAPTGDKKDHLKRFGEAASQLYQNLMAPLIKDLGSASKLVIVPDGGLNGLPFELLLTGWEGTEDSFKELHYLMRETSITHLLSSRTGFQQTRYGNGKGVLGFGFVGEGITDERSELGNLPGALREIEFLSSRFEGDYFIGEQGTKQQFLKRADDYAILHLAIHGKSDPNSRFGSSLVFNGDKDYLLTSSDLYGTDLKSQLAVLSACETGVGQLSEGEGTFSIARGFAIAGVPSIVTTLWKVNDISASKISKQFYQNLEKGMPKDNALRMAKLSFLEQADNLTESPFYWGHFALIGNPAPIEMPKKINQTLKVLAILLAICLLVYFIHKKTGDTTSL